MDKLFVFDTNAFISAALLEGSVNGHALEKAFEIGIVAVSIETFTEFNDVLFRRKFDRYFTDERRLQIIEKLEKDTLMFEVNIKVDACRDPKDNKFLELAITSEASCIVSGDLDLLVLNPFNNIAILSASDFLKSSFL